MKRNSLVQLTSAWWKEQEPKGLASGKDFAKALAEHDIALSALRKTGAEGAHEAFQKALKNIEAAAAKVLAEATRLAKTPPKDPKKPTHDLEEQAWTVESFKKIGKAIDEARAQATALKRTASGAQAEDDPDEGDVLGNVEAFKVYLKSSLMRLRKQPMNMAFVSGKDPLESRALLHKSTAGKALASRLAKETGIKKVAWGSAQASDDDANAIMFSLEGPKVSGLKKRCELMLKTFKPQPFTRFIVMVEGREDASDDEEAEREDEGPDGEAGKPTSPIPPAPPLLGVDPDQAARFARRLKELMPAITQATQAGVPGADMARQKAADAATLFRKGQLDEARGLLDQTEKLLKAALAARAAGKTATPSAPSTPGSVSNQPASSDGFSIVAFQKSRLAWLAARKAVQEQLRKLEDAIVSELKGDPDLPDLQKDVRRLDEVLQALDERLIDRLDDALNAKTPQERQRFHQEASVLMNGYRRYVDSDELVGEIETNPFVPVAIRATVLRTLDAMQKTMGSPQA